MSELENISQVGSAENTGNTGMMTAAIKAVKDMFPDGFRRVGKDIAVYGWVIEVDGIRIGVIAATKTPRYADSIYFILNKRDLDKLLAGESIDVALVITATVDKSGKWTVVDVIEAHELTATLANVEPRTGGKLGDFYLLTAHFETEEEEEGF
jgi:hypothetical protein